MNNFFINITKKLDLRPCKNSNLTDINVIISNFNNHVSIRKIREFFPNNWAQQFKYFFSLLKLKDVEKILNLNAKNSSAKRSIPATILNHCVDIYLSFLANSKNYAICESAFPYKLKRSEVIPLFQKEDPLRKESYRPMSLLPYISKVFERLIYKQFNHYIDNNKTDYRKTHGTQHSLITMLEKRKNSLDKSEPVSFLLMDLSESLLSARLSVCLSVYVCLFPCSHFF